MSHFCKFSVYKEKTVVEGGERAAYYGILDSIEDGGDQLSYANTDELAHTHTYTLQGADPAIGLPPTRSRHANCVFTHTCACKTSDRCVMPTPSNAHSTNTHPCGWPNPTSFHWLRPLSSPCLHTPNGKPHLLMPHTSPAGWQRHRHGELDSELQIMDLRLRELGREPAPALAKHRMSMADLIVPAYSALFQTPICIVNTAESSRAVERELLPLQMKGNGHINGGPC